MMTSLKFPQPLLIIALVLIPYILSGKTAGITKSNHARTNNAVESGQNVEILEDGMYVIVGVFKIATNAAQYAKSIQIGGKNPKVGKHEVNELYYVYAYKTKDELQFIREKRAELRATSQFFDAWILYVGISLEELLAKATPAKPAYVLPPEPAPVVLPKAKNVDIYQLQFNVINASNQQEVAGNVSIVDATSGQTLQSVSTNEIHSIQPPDNGTKEVIVTCDIFGFEKEQVVLKVDDPLSSPDNDKISQKDGVTTITFALSRIAKVNEMLTLYNVYFYSDAVILKPESELELNNLLSMLQENEQLKIRIHGHTNGNAKGTIMRLKEDDDNYFEITENNIEGFGTAKELSKGRAEIIMRWLVSHGIDNSRMEIKAWGGKKMIYKRKDPLAEKNVRVEIEIMQI